MQIVDSGPRFAHIFGRCGFFFLRGNHLFSFFPFFFLFFFSDSSSFGPTSDATNSSKREIRSGERDESWSERRKRLKWKREQDVFFFLSCSCLRLARLYCLAHLALDRNERKNENIDQIFNILISKRAIFDNVENYLIENVYHIWILLLIIMCGWIMVGNTLPHMIQ